MPRLTTLKPKISTIDTRQGVAPAERTRGRKLQRIRDRILLRDEYTCKRCRHTFAPWFLEVDHIVPLAEGGRDNDANRQTLCKRCHKAKSAEEERER